MKELLLISQDTTFYGIDRGEVSTQSSGDPKQMTVRSATAVTTLENVDTPFSSEKETHFCPGVQGGVEQTQARFSDGVVRRFAMRVGGNGIDKGARHRLAMLRHMTNLAAG